MGVNPPSRRREMRRLTVAVTALAVLAAGCGSSGAAGEGDVTDIVSTTGTAGTTPTAPPATSTTPATSGTTAPANDTMTFQIWLVRGEAVWPVMRAAPKSPAVATAALGALL